MLREAALPPKGYSSFSLQTDRREQFRQSSLDIASIADDVERHSAAERFALQRAIAAPRTAGPHQCARARATLLRARLNSPHLRRASLQRCTRGGSRAPVGPLATRRNADEDPRCPGRSRHRGARGCRGADRKGTAPRDPRDGGDRIELRQAEALLALAEGDEAAADGVCSEGCDCSRTTAQLSAHGAPRNDVKCGRRVGRGRCRDRARLQKPGEVPGVGRADAFELDTPRADLASH